MKTTLTDEQFIDYAERPDPFLARHPGVGYAIFAIGTLLFCLVAWQVVTHGPLTQWDDPISKGVFQWAKQQPQWLVLIMRGLSSFGRDGVGLIAVVLSVGWIRRKARRELWMLYFGVLGGELWFQALSNVVMRHRPVFDQPFEKLTGPGFPSGHAATNVLLGWMTLSLILPHLKTVRSRVLLILAVVLVVVGIIFSRQFLGDHYPTDLLAGTLLGFAWGGLIFTVTDLYFYRWHRTQRVVEYKPTQGSVIPVTNHPEHK